MKTNLTALSFIFFLNFCFAQDILNINLIANEIRDDVRYSGSWSYIDDDSNEYAILGARSGTAIFSISSQGAVEEVAFIPGPASNWREITVLGKSAFITTEGEDSTDTGMQVIELMNLPDTAYLISNYNEHFTRGHIIQRDIYTEDPYVYVMGTQTTRGVHIIDVSDPMNPTQVGLYNPGYYIHDAHVNGNLLFACAFNESKVDVIDITDKTNPTFVTEILDPGGSTHSAWLTEDKSHLILADELDGLPGRIFNIEDIDDIYEVATFSSNLESLVHNPYVRGDFAFIAHNTEGLRVYDVKDPSLPVEVGYYDTFAGASGGFSGLWSACPYYPSGRIIGGDRTKGLFVWEFEETRAARIYGTVVDSITGLPIANGRLVNPALNDTLFTDSDGKFKTGLYPGAVSFVVSAIGYEDKLAVLNLAENEDLQLVVKLSPINSNVEMITSRFFLNIFPNPAVDEISLEFSNNLVGNRLELMSSIGLKLLDEKIRNVSMQIDIEDFQTGIYLINIRDRNGNILKTDKFVKD